MRPAVIAFALALFLFILVQGIRPPVLYAALLIPVAIFVYGFVAEELPVTKFEDDEEGEGEEENGDEESRNSGIGGSSGK